jgi:hypothetical protein
MSLLTDLQAAGLPVTDAYDGQYAQFSRALSAFELELYLDILFPIRISQRARLAQASKTARAIPSWALWTQAEAEAWVNTNIATPLASARTNLPATLTLATARAAFVVLLGILDKMWVLQKANMQMTLSFRDEIWPDLPERTTIK